MIEEDQHGKLSSAPVDMEYDNSSIEQSTYSHSSKHDNKHDKHKHRLSRTRVTTTSTGAGASTVAHASSISSMNTIGTSTPSVCSSGPIIGPTA